MTGNIRTMHITLIQFLVYRCGGEIGIFLSVKRCVLILLHNDNGWFMNAPYLDSHGEVDLGLR